VEEEEQLFGKRDYFFHIPFLAFKVKDKTETRDTSSNSVLFPELFVMQFSKESTVF